MVRLVENIPFFSIFIMMAGGIVTPLLGSRNRARILHLVMVGAVAVMSGLLLGYTSDGTCLRFMMGHFPAPWGNEVRAGALEALMSLVFSLVMFLTVAANKRSLEHDIPGERAGLYYVMMNLLFSSLLALIYTNDLFTAFHSHRNNAGAASNSQHRNIGMRHHLLSCLKGRFCDSDDQITDAAAAEGDIFYHADQFE